MKKFYTTPADARKITADFKESLTITDFSEPSSGPNFVDGQFLANSDYLLTTALSCFDGSDDDTGGLAYGVWGVVNSLGGTADYGNTHLQGGKIREHIGMYQPSVVIIDTIMAAFSVLRYRGVLVPNPTYGAVLSNLTTAIKDEYVGNMVGALYIAPYNDYPAVSERSLSIQDTLANDFAWVQSLPVYQNNDNWLSQTAQVAAEIAKLTAGIVYTKSQAGEAYILNMDSVSASNLNKVLLLCSLLSAIAYIAD